MFLKTKVKTAFLYVGFAIISTVVNLLSQYVSFLIYSGFLSLYFAMSVGTLSGLVVKYILDKRFIFFYTAKSKKDNGKKFLLYSLMGVFTTFVFWGFEIVFDYLFDKKYTGAIVGLLIGYIIKYNLDKKFVFKSKDSL